MNSLIFFYNFIRDLIGNMDVPHDTEDTAESMNEDEEKGFSSNQMV